MRFAFDSDINRYCTMKKIFLITMAFFAISFNLAAQSSFYVKIGGGYSFPLSSQNIGMNTKNIYWRDVDPETGAYIPAIINEYKEVKGSYSAGINASATVGYNITENIGAEISTTYINGKEYKTSAIGQDIINDEGITVTNSSSRIHKSAASVILVSPSLRLTAPDGFLRPYLTAGPVLGFATLETEYDARSDYEDENSEIRHERYSGGVSVGMRGALGVDIRLNDALALFSEVAFNSISYSPKEKELTKYVVNDVNRLPDLTERDRRTVFDKNYTTDTRVANYNDPDKPAKASPVSFAMNNLMVNVGLKLVL
jgi:hypothetical protein